MRRVVLAMVHHCKTEFLLQLRDFKPTILHPGRWGAISGSWEDGESSEEAMYRELWEELTFRPSHLKFVATIPLLPDNASIDMYACPVEPVSMSITLREGQEVGWFLAADIFAGELPSRKWNRRFPVTPNLRFLLSEFLASDRS